MAKAQINDPILYSDWDAIQSVVYEQLGPLQEVAGNPGVYIEGTGYGLATNQLISKAYPFTRTVKRISSEAQARVEFVDDHNLVVGEVIYFSNFTTHANYNNVNNWSGYDIADNYATVVTVVSTTVVEVDFNTFNYNPSDNGAVLWETYNPASNTGHSCDANQYYISANQFVNLRADLTTAVRHITGAVPGPGNLFPGGEITEMPTPARGAVIRYDVYDPYYEVANSINTYKYFSAVQQQYQPTLGSAARNATAWNQSTFFEFYVDFSDAYDFVQFFNTGGLVQIQFPVSDTVVENANNDNVFNLNRHWRDLIRLVFPLYVGARGKTQMGLDADSRSIASIGAFDVAAVDTQIAGATGDQITAYTDKYDDHYVRVYMREVVNQTRLNFIIELFDSSNTNSYASQTDVDREIKLVFDYSDYIPLRATPQNYTIGLVRTWTT